MRRRREYGSALVLGAGVSGCAAAKLLLAEQTAVTVVDSRDEPVINGRAGMLEDAGATVRLTCRDLPSDPFDVCVVSPGIPAASAGVQSMEARGVEVIAELELAARRCPWPILAVTGSNGKSTAVKLCAEAMAAAGLRARAGANYGAPLSELVLKGEDLDWVVAEVSSFQLERVNGFRPRVGVILNIQPNHLDRHGDMAAYAALKARLLERMGGNDVAVVLDEDARAVTAASRGLSRWVTFGASPAASFRWEDGQVQWPNGQGRREVPFRGTYFDNPVLGLTAAAAVAAMEAVGVNGEAAGHAAAAFTPLPHRMEVVARLGDVVFVDDSKATSFPALRAALRMAPGPVRLIAGGRAKGGDPAQVKDLLATRARGVYVIGECAAALESAWRDAVRCVPCGALGTAVRAAYRDAQPGECVLLAPGCASFDQFANFEARGAQYAALVREMAAETNNRRMAPG